MRKNKMRSFLNGARIALAALLVAAPARADSRYLIQCGDELEIHTVIQGSLRDLSQLSVALPIIIMGDAVYSHLRVIVSPDGYISVPGIPSPVAVEGLSVEEIQADLLEAFVPKSSRGQITVSLVRPHGSAFFVWGEVRQPGRFVMDHPVTLFEGLAYAGGPTDRARLNRVRLLRGEEDPVDFDLSHNSAETASASAFLLKPLDTVVVPKRRTPDSLAIIIFLTALSTAAAIHTATK